MSIIEQVKSDWGWTGIAPTELVAENEFGNLILKDADNKFWRLCPEEVYCEVIAETIADYNKLIDEDEFTIDWNMAVMVDEATELLGPLEEGFKYTLKTPGVLDGEYSGSNFKIASFIEIIKSAGELGKQIKDLPDGSEFKFKVIE